MLLGAIDVGTNSIHLVVVELDADYGTWRTVRKAREMVRLGGGDALATGRLGRKAIVRGVEAIARFAAIARESGAGAIRAVATSAVREAANGAEFVAAVDEACGVRIEVLAAIDEARLIYLGASRGFPLGDRNACIFDIGGGSTEFIVGDAERPHFLHSEPIGSLRLYERFARDDRPGGPDWAGLDAYLRERLEPVGRRIAEYRYELVIGTSGTVMGLATLDAARRGRPPERVHGYVLPTERLAALRDELVALSPAERRKLPGMNPRRADILAAGATIVLAIVRTLGAAELVVCERALREGIVADFLERSTEGARRVGDARRGRFDAVQSLARRFGEGGAHGDRVAALAVRLFDATTDLHGLGATGREVLFAAGLLHDVGRIIAPSGHHKHGAYIVREAGLPGWTATEVELVAALVRYHRKSLPKPTHPEWLAADAETQRRIGILGGILRIAEGLDRRHLGVALSLQVRRSGSALTVVLESEQDAGPELDGARFKADLLERTLGVAILFDPARVAIDAEPLAPSREGALW